MAPLAAALAALAVGAFAQTPSFKRACRDYVPDKRFERSEGTVRKIVDAYAGADPRVREYTFQHLDSPTASPEAQTPGYPNSTLVFFQWGDNLWNSNFTHEDLNQVKCVLAHEVAHAKLDHRAKHHAKQLERHDAIFTPQKKAEIDKQMKDLGCAPNGSGGWTGYSCDKLKKALDLEAYLSDPEIVAMMRADELEADHASLQLVRDVPVDGKAGDPWACWSMMLSLPDRPEGKDAKKDAGPPDTHPPREERAKKLAGALQAMGGPQPCL